MVERLFGPEATKIEDEEESDNDSSKKGKKKALQKDRVRDLNWAQVAELVGNGRKSAECMRRYNKISGNRGGEKAGALKGPWTEEEDRKVIELVTAHGAKKWSQIAAELPGKKAYHLSTYYDIIESIRNEKMMKYLIPCNWNSTIVFVLL